MSYDIKIIIYNSDNEKIISQKILSFSFSSDVFTAYTTLRSRIILSDDFKFDKLDSVNRVEFIINNNTLHNGFIDTLEYSFKENVCMVDIVSKGFTALMTQNYLTPGIYSNISFNSLMDNYISLPYVSHEDNDETINYIYVKDDKSFWDSVVNFAYKKNNSFPYITNGNKVNITVDENRSFLKLPESRVVKKGVEFDYRAIISDIYMQDADGNYDKYSMENKEAKELNIYRRKEIALDRQYLYNPQEVLIYRIKNSMRKKKCEYIEIYGFFLAQLYYKLNCGDVDGKDIVKIKVFGDDEGIFTRYSVM
jgi:hypothetical protein